MKVWHVLLMVCGLVIAFTLGAASTDATSPWGIGGAIAGFVGGFYFGALVIAHLVVVVGSER